MKSTLLPLIAATALLAGCVDGTQVAQSWVDANDLIYPYGGTKVSQNGQAMASVAVWGDVVSVSTAAGSETGSSVATDGASTGVVAHAGNAEVALGASGSYVAISTSTTSAMSSISADGATSAGATQAGNATSSW